jgi:hypothetical protein
VRRNYFQIEYPKNELPKIYINRHRYFVINISEIGVKVQCPFSEGLGDGELRINFQFLCGEVARAKRYVHRYGQKEVAIQFTQNIPYRFIVKEQIHRRNQKFSEEDLLGANPR